MPAAADGQGGGIGWLLDIALIVLLALTLFHALRLERALGVLRRDRAALEELVAGFNASTRQAELGVERLRAATDGAGRQIGRQLETAGALKDDLVFLIERGERLADRLDGLVRAARKIAPEPPRPAPPDYPPAETIAADRVPPDPSRAEPPERPPRLRSQAERDLLRALKLPR
jgi:hypothetical protein